MDPVIVALVISMVLASGVGIYLFRRSQQPQSERSPVRHAVAIFIALAVAPIAITMILLFVL